MSLVKGPFEVKYGVDVLAGIEELDFSLDVNTDDFETVQGKAYEVTKSLKVAVEATFLESDVASLAVVLPQYFVPNGGVLSTGETVTDSDGAIDVNLLACGDSGEQTDVVITSCGDPGWVVRLPDCTTEISDIEIDSVVKVHVRFKGEASGGAIQLFREGAVTISS